MIALDAMAVLAKMGAAHGMVICDAATPDAEIKRMDALGMCGFGFFSHERRGHELDKPAGVECGGMVSILTVYIS